MRASLAVLKFGSSVLQNCEWLTAVVHEIYRYYRRGNRVLAVVSGIGNHTDVLLGEAQYWVNPAGPERSVAALLATAELQSAALLTIALTRAGVPATQVTPSEIELTVCGDRLDAWPVSVDRCAIDKVFLSTPVMIVPGFIGVHETGGTALMGRGGSDLTAIFLADVLKAAECRLVKDVDGIYEHDPHDLAAEVVTRNRPRRYHEVTYEDALLASSGLVQSKAIKYLRDHRINADVAGLLQEEGTRIGTSATVVRDLRHSPPLKVMLLGLGQIGQGVYHHLRKLAAYFQVVGIHVRDAKKERDFPVPDGLLGTDIEGLLEQTYDILVDVCNDASLAKRAIESSLKTGRPAVTASKRLVVCHGLALSMLATNSGADFLYSAAVGGSAPMIEAVNRALKNGPIRCLRGVLSGACNYVLDELAKGVPVHTAVSRARQRYASSNGLWDLHGDDSVDKLQILARLAFGADSAAVTVIRQGLSPIDAAQLRKAEERDSVTRLVATFDPTTSASVKLESLAPNDYLTGARGDENRLIFPGHPASNGGLPAPALVVG